MDCIRIEKLLDTYLDRELDRDRAAAVERHLQLCDECGRKLEDYAEIASSIKKHATYRPARASLVHRIRTQIAAAPSPARAPMRQRRYALPEWNRWLQFGAAIASAVVMTSVVTLQLAGIPEDQKIVEQILSGHSRAVLTSHEIDVASSDQHTVKPWLSSRLDFSPMVTDLTTSGFPLRGGRLDYVNHRPVAVLVYAHRQHVIDLFIWPDEAAPDTSRSRSFARRGLNVLQWSAGGMTYWAVSDLNSADLAAFAERYASAM